MDRQVTARGPVLAGLFGAGLVAGFFLPTALFRLDVPTAGVAVITLALVTLGLTRGDARWRYAAAGLLIGVVAYAVFLYWLFTTWDFSGFDD